MIVLPLGIGMPKLLVVKQQPMPKITSAVLQEVVHRLRDGAAARAERQRMRLGEGALAPEAGHDRALQQLGQLPQPAQALA